MNHHDSTTNPVAIDEFEIDEADLDLVLGGLRNRATSSKVLDLANGWCGTDADF